MRSSFNVTVDKVVFLTFLLCFIIVLVDKPLRNLQLKCVFELPNFVFSCCPMRSIHFCSFHIATSDIKYPFPKITLFQHGYSYLYCLLYI